MKTSFLKLIQSSLFVFVSLGLMLGSVSLMAQESTEEEDTLEVIQDNSSAFNDSVQFDDMEPVFYEAAEEDEEAVAENEGMGGIVLYVGIAVVLIIVLIVLKKAGKKKT